MFGIKDLEVLKKLAGILFIPLFTIARLIDESKAGIDGKDIYWLMNHPWPLLQHIGFVSWIITTLLLVAGILFFIKVICCWLNAEFGVESFVEKGVGTLCITIGLLALPGFFLKTAPLVSWNVFWSFGFLTFGFTCFDRQ